MKRYKQPSTLLQKFLSKKEIQEAKYSLPARKEILSFLTPLQLKPRTLGLKHSRFLNQKGVTLLSMMLITLLSSFGYLIILKALNENFKIKEQVNLLLCQKEFEFSKRSYIKRMSQFNSLIKVAFSLRFIPVTAPYALKVQQGAKKMQQVYHFSHLKNPLQFDHCSSLIGITYFNNLPYKTNKKILLVRKFDGTVPLKGEKWSDYLWSKNKRFWIKSEFKMQSRFQSSPKVKRNLLSREVLSNLKDSFGPPFS